MSGAVRVTLTLSGGASLGAYQAGATAALLVALEHVRDEHGVDVRVDALGGASAGAIVALIAAYSLLEGVSGRDVLYQAWVERVSIDTLLRRGSRGPLSLEGVRAELPELLRGARRGPRQQHPLALHVALTGLRGLTYDLPGLRHDEPVSAVTFADWKDFVLEPGGGPAQYFEPHLRSPLDAVLASASHPGAFAPRVLDRREDRDAYAAQGIENLPRSGWLWYTDGGLVQTEPVGRTLSAARGIDGPPDAHRLNLLIDPRSEEPTDAEQWSDRDHEATWAGGLARALAVLPEQALYEDLRRLQRDNRRIEWLDDLEQALDGHLNERAADGLRGLIERIDGERDQIRAGGRPDPPDRDASAKALLRAAIERISGLARKDPVDVDVISPLLLRGDEDVDLVGDLLAGEMLGDFGGFLQADLRRSDFALGYASVLAWAPDGLAACGLPDATVDAGVQAARDAQPDEWEQVRRGDAGGRDLPWRARLRLAHFLLRGVRALLRG
ncbi:MAG TPA: patatin-like phospholipase family protein [Solirubrobacter sp.]|nr:patatin-like phospholipase family protein [Solirubrobacter sp.]